MAKKGFISETVGGGRIVSHGQITSLLDGFSLPNGEPFSVYIRPKTLTSNLDTVLNVRLYQEDGFAPAPVVFNDWSPLLISEIAPDADLLTLNDVYWGSGQAVEDAE